MSIEIADRPGNRGNTMSHRVEAQREAISKMVRASIKARRRNRLARKFKMHTDVVVTHKPNGLFSAPVKAFTSEVRQLIDEAIQHRIKQGKE